MRSGQKYHYVFSNFDAVEKQYSYRITEVLDNSFNGRSINRSAIFEEGNYDKLIEWSDHEQDSGTILCSHNLGGIYAANVFLQYNYNDNMPIDILTYAKFMKLAVDRMYECLELIFEHGLILKNSFGDSVYVAKRRNNNNQEYYMFASVNNDDASIKVGVSIGGAEVLEYMRREFRITSEILSHNILVII